MPRRAADSESATQQSMRLQHFLAHAGLDSRRACEEYISSGRITVDGKEVRELGIKIDPARQRISVDGELVRPQPTRYFLINKPKGFVCTNRDPAGRPRAVDLVTSGRHLRLFTVGRLDQNSEGLLLVTNDGELAHRLAHPRFQVTRTYRVQVAGIPDPAKIRQLTDGLHFSEGHFRLKHARRLRTQGNSSFLELELTEGRNREIRRLFARVGHKVMHLQRVGFGPLRLKRLKSGDFRPLTKAEVEALKKFAAAPLSRRPQQAKAFRHSERQPAKVNRKKASKQSRSDDSKHPDQPVHPAVNPADTPSQITRQRKRAASSTKAPRRNQRTLSEARPDRSKSHRSERTKDTSLITGSDEVDAIEPSERNPSNDHGPGRLRKKRTASGRYGSGKSRKAPKKKRVAKTGAKKNSPKKKSTKRSKVGRKGRSAKGRKKS